MQEKKEIEGRDIMNLVRTTAENVRGIVIDGQRQIEHDREVRASQQSNNNQPNWVMAHPKYSNQPHQLEAASQDPVSNYMKQVIEAKEKLQRE